MNAMQFQKGFINERLQGVFFLATTVLSLEPFPLVQWRLQVSRSALKEPPG